MTRDYSQFFTAKPSTSDRQRTVLEQLGWQSFFASQIDLAQMTATPPVRVIEVHRNGLHVRGERHDLLIPPGPDATVGDWLLLDEAQPGQSEVLHRKSLFQRRAPGKGREVQLIAANVDTVFITTSCNHDFNVARLERYLALAFEAECAPVIVLTKPDLSDDPDTFRQQAEAISKKVPVVMVNALGTDASAALAGWCKPGQTVAFLGSSGVGKSTLVNALLGEDRVATSGIREDDSKGRHTTTTRQLHFLPRGCAVLDTPGMREIQMTDAEAGIAELFSDLEDLAARCKFRDCAHDTEPGCAVRAALDAGTIDAERMARWQKLIEEERFNATSLAERKAEGKGLARRIKEVKRLKPRYDQSDD